MKLLTSIIILFSNDPEISIQIKKAAFEKIKLERNEQFPFLSSECVTAIGKLKKEYRSKK